MSGDENATNTVADVSDDQNFTFAVALGFVDGDGHLDAVFANYDGRNRVCLGDGAGGFSSCNDVNEEENETFDVALGFVDGDSHLDAVFANHANRNRVCRGDGNGGFSSCSDAGNDEKQASGVTLGELGAIVILVDGFESLTPGG